MENTFNRSAWAREEFARHYLENADIYVIERRRMIGMMTSLFTHFFDGKGDIHVLDLGCGDGVLTEELMKKSDSLVFTLVDRSEYMLQKAKERLKAHERVCFINAGFQELLEDKVLLRTFDFCVSSLAIHHLEREGKAALFKYIAGHLKSGGHFVNIDVVAPPSEELEGWYFNLWREWMQFMMNHLNVWGELPDDIIKRYKDPSSANKPDTLEFQLEALKEAGLKDVDCYYKNGLFAVFGGKK